TVVAASPVDEQGRDVVGVAVGHSTSGTTWTPSSVSAAVRRPAAGSGAIAGPLLRGPDSRFQWITPPSPSFGFQPRGGCVGIQVSALLMAVELTCPAVARVAGPVRPIATSDGTVRGYTTGASTDVAHQNSRAPSLDDTGHVLTVGSRHPVNRRNNQSGQQDLSVFRPRADAVPPTGRYADVPVCGGVAPDQAPENITPSPRVRSTDPVIVELL